MNLKILEQITKWMDEGCKGMELAHNYTQYMDHFLSDIFSSVDKNAPFALLATGGYGRQELAPYSDIDIMFFAQNRVSAETAERILYKLWDSGLEISHAFRTAEECIEEAFKDIRTRTALLESRYVAGDVKLYNKFRNEVYPVLTHKKRRLLSGTN